MKKSKKESYSFSQLINSLIQKLGKYNIPGAEEESYRK
jgi:hypothetical protein